MGSLQEGFPMALRFTIGKKLTAAFLAVSCASALVGAVASDAIETLALHDRELFERSTAPMHQLLGLTEALLGIRLALNDGFLAPDRAATAAQADLVERHLRELSAQAALYEHGIRSEEQKRAFTAFQSSRAELERKLQLAVAALRANRKDELRGLVQADGPVRALLTEEEQSLKTMSEVKMRNGLKVAGRNDVEARAARARVLVAALVAAAAALALGIAIGRSFARALQSMAAAAERLSKGEWAVELSHASDDEMGDLARSLRGISEYLGSRAATATALGAGELKGNSAGRGDGDALGAALSEIGAGLSRVQQETSALAGAAADGRLTARGRTEDLRGVYGEVVGGLNRILGAVSEPLAAAAAYAAKLGEGRAPDPMPGAFCGELETLRQSLNRCGAAIRALAADAEKVARAGMAGDSVGTRGPAVSPG